MSITIIYSTPTTASSSALNSSFVSLPTPLATLPFLRSFLLHHHIVLFVFELLFHLEFSAPLFISLFQVLSLSLDFSL